MYKRQMVGIDVASEHVDVAAIGAAMPPARYGNESEGHSALAATLVAAKTGLVVMEATGGYYAALDAVLQSAGDVGPVASASLIADLPELGRLNRRQIAAMTGVAPYAQDSGQHHGRRRIAGGRFELRRALHGHPRRHPPQPGHPQLLPAPPGRWQVQEGRLDRLHAQAPGILNAMAKTRTTFDPDHANA